MRRLAFAVPVVAFALAACGGNAGDLDAFCAAATEAAEVAPDIDSAADASELQTAYEALDLHIQAMGRTAPEEIATDMRLVVNAWSANLDALQDVQYDASKLAAPEDPEEGDEYATAAADVEQFVADECDVELDTGPR